MNTTTLLDDYNITSNNLFDRNDDFFMDYMSFKRLCNVFAIIIPTFIVWELFIVITCVKGGKKRFDHCAGPRYFARCLAYLCMCVGLVCYGRYAIHQYSIERYNYYGPMDILSTNLTRIIQFERYQHLDKFDIRGWSCPYLNGTAPTPEQLNGEDDDLGFGTCNPNVMTGTLRLSWTCDIAGKSSDNNGNGGSIRGGGTSSSDGRNDQDITTEETTTKTCTNSIVQICKETVWGSGWRGADTDEDRFYFASKVKQCLIDNNYVNVFDEDDDNNDNTDTSTSPIYAYGDCNTCRVTLQLPSELKQRNLKLSGQILFWSGFVILLICISIAVRYCKTHDDTCLNPKKEQVFIPPPPPQFPKPAQMPKPTTATAAPTKQAMVAKTTDAAAATTTTTPSTDSETSSSSASVLPS